MTSSALPPRHDPDYYRSPAVYRQYKVEHWEPPLRSLTFLTETLPLSRQEAMTLCRLGEQYKHEAMYQRALARDRNEQPNHAQIIADAKQKVNASLSDADKETLHGVRARLSPAIERCVASRGGAFVKLSTRSPKDAGLSTTALKAYVRDVIYASYLDPRSKDAETEDMIAFVRGSIRSLRVTSADEAISLILSSNRSFGDLKLAELTSDGDAFDLQLIVREFVDIDPLWEFRAFVFDNELTSCTQYYSIAFVPAIAARRREIEARILSFFKTQIQPLPAMQALRDYTLDLVLSPSNDSVRVIELNPPPPLAGSALFEWDNAADRHAILYGPYTLRVLERPLANPKEHIYSHVRHYMNTLRGLEPLTTHHRACSVCGKPVTPVFWRCTDGACVDWDCCCLCFENHVHPSPHHHVYKVDTKAAPAAGAPGGPAAAAAAAHNASTEGEGEACALM